jgi:hypothetical protein
MAEWSSGSKKLTEVSREGGREGRREGEREGGKMAKHARK